MLDFAKPGQHGHALMIAVDLTETRLQPDVKFDLRHNSKWDTTIRQLRTTLCFQG
jgi:hypothetical protein